MKYLVAPSLQIARHWANSMEIPQKDWALINTLERMRARRFKASEVVFVEGEPFDYPPPPPANLLARSEYISVLAEMPRRIEIDI